jgi:hypothetical protein
MNDFHSTEALAAHRRAEIQAHAQRARLARSAKGRKGGSRTNRPGTLSRLAESLRLF